MISYDKNYIRVVDGVLPEALCASMRYQFEQDIDYANEVPGRLWELDVFQKQRQGRALWKPTLNLANWEPLTEEVMRLIKQPLYDYAEAWDPCRILPGDFAMEGLRVKCYRPGVHEFKTHSDQVNRESSTRFIACLFYLNSSEAGTEFPNEGYTVQAREGRMVMFPPSWCFPHRGIMPMTATKYIMSTYLHYRD